jgi:SAM-dependent methyltransferase
MTQPSAHPPENSHEAASHARYSEQARWTRELRSRLLSQLRVSAGDRILEVGSGTGVITRALEVEQRCRVVGLDIEPRVVSFASHLAPSSLFTVGDGRALPFPDSLFDAVVCHYLLLWVRDPVRAVIEMARVTISGRPVVAFAEPDYAARIDFPDSLARLGKIQADSLFDEGADPRLGRKLRGLFASAGLTHIHSGLLGGDWSSQPDAEFVDSEWRTFERDLRGRVPPAELEDLRAEDAAAWRRGDRVLFVPTFFAVGFKS